MLIPFDQLFTRHGVQPVGVLHVGAHEGQEAEAYNQLRVPRVIWVEANPETHRKLVAHVGRMPGHSTILACVADEDGKPVDFHIASNAGQSSSILEWGTHTLVHPEVRWTRHLKMKTSRLDTLIHDRGVRLKPGWFLNLDLQGAELRALKGLGSLIDFFNWAYIEVNEQQLYKGCPLVGEMDAFMSAAGFRRAETQMSGNHGWGDALYTRIV
jgi:FkbM family methyltransferase